MSPLYEFHCLCGQDLTTSRSMSEETLSKNCHACGGIAERKWTTFGVSLSMPGHFNWSLGRYVSNRKDLEDGFKKSSEQASERLGVEHRFVPADPTELKA